MARPTDRVVMPALRVPAGAGQITLARATVRPACPWPVRQLDTKPMASAMNDLMEGA